MKYTITIGSSKRVLITMKWNRVEKAGSSQSLKRSLMTTHFASSSPLGMPASFLRLEFGAREGTKASSQQSLMASSKSRSLLSKSWNSLEATVQWERPRNGLSHLRNQHLISLLSLPLVELIIRSLEGQRLSLWKSEIGRNKPGE